MEASERTDDAFAISWTMVLSSLHWIGVGNWRAANAATARGREVAAKARHRHADEALLLAGVSAYQTARYGQAATWAAEGAAAGRERRDPVVQLWGLMVLAESLLRGPAGDEAVGRLLDEARGAVARGVATIDAVRMHLVGARNHLAADRIAPAWDAVRTASRLAGGRTSFAQYTLEGHAGIPEVCLALVERARTGDGLPPTVDPAELRATAAAGLRRLRTYARVYPMARPRALTCLGWSLWLDGRRGAAVRAWARALRRAERLAMPYEVARAHHELGRHLAPGRRSPLGLDAAAHLAAATAGFAAIGDGGPAAIEPAPARAAADG
jgi:hypothetical protein